MKEFTSAVRVGPGLRRDSRNPRNSVGLTVCTNLRPTPIMNGEAATLATFSPPTDPFSPDADTYLQTLGGSYAVSHPQPALLKGREVTLLVHGGAGAIRPITEGSNWTAGSAYTVKDAYDISSTGTISGTGSWHFADFGDAYCLVNGSCTIIKSNRWAMFGGFSDLVATDTPTVTTCCASRGRMIMGGFDSSDFFNEEWEAFLRAAFDIGVGIAWPGLPDTNWVWWSQIGSHAFWLFYPKDSIEGLVDGGEEPYTYNNPMLWEMIERNEMGFMPMNWQGTVRCVKSLGKGVMVYGDNGVSYMPMAGNTYGLSDLLSHGVANRSAVGGNEMEHIFLDEAGYLWRVDASNPFPQRLGYKEFFEGMVDNDVVIQYAPVEDEYYISDGTDCFCLTRAGLFKTTFLTTSVVYGDGVDIGLYVQPGNSDDDYAYLTSDTLDMGLRSVKTLERVILTITTGTKTEVSAYWRMSSGDSWAQTDWSVCNSEGVAYLPIMAVEFKIAVRCSDYSDIAVDEVEAQFKTDDKRVIRGTYALKTAS